jgi:prepilin-type N-terminal cleavage/methylation domain-containing protein/prepilin-type processing-associated H-X9-DG protein
MGNHQRSGFTLIELLVVIAIIAVLAAILFPVFAAARKKAQQTTCLSHEKQFALAYISYAHDYNDTVAPWTNAQGKVLQDFMLPYTTTKAMYVCPSDTGLRYIGGPTYKPTYSFWRNSYLDRWSGYFATHPIKLGAIPFPTLIVFIGDGPSNSGEHTWGLNPTNPLQTQWPGYRFGDDRHSGLGDYAFVDGHVKALLPTAIQSTNTDSATDTIPKWGSPAHPQLPSCDGSHPWYRP